MKQKVPIKTLFKPNGRALLGFLVIITLLLTNREQVGAAMEKHFLYFPDSQLQMTPGNVNLDYEDVFFPAADGTMLHGWFIPARQQMPVVLFFHGNAGNIAGRLYNLVKLNQLGLPIFIFDYRGYGQSQGEPSEQGLYKDARGAHAWLEKRSPEANQIIYFGRSLGAAVALQLALEKPPAGLILESPFTSLAAMGKKHYPGLYSLFGWLISAKYDNDEKIKKLKSPLLLIHGTADTVVPVEMGVKLYDLARNTKKLHLIDGADHNDGYFLETTDYWAVWQSFLQDIP